MSREFFGFQNGSSGTLRLAGAEHRAMLGSNPSAVSGAKTSDGGRVLLRSASSVLSLLAGIGAQAENPRGLGTASPAA